MSYCLEFMMIFLWLKLCFIMLLYLSTCGNRSWSLRMDAFSTENPQQPNQECIASPMRFYLMLLSLLLFFSVIFIANGVMKRANFAI